MSLCDKETNWMKETKWDVSDPENPEVTEWETQNGFETQNVKQFIKELKFLQSNRMCSPIICPSDMLDIIDELAGKGLI